MQIAGFSLRGRVEVAEWNDGENQNRLNPGCPYKGKAQLDLTAGDYDTGKKGGKAAPRERGGGIAGGRVRQTAIKGRPRDQKKERPFKVASKKSKIQLHSLKGRRKEAKS